MQVSHCLPRYPRIIPRKVKSLRSEYITERILYLPSKLKHCQQFVIVKIIDARNTSHRTYKDVSGDNWAISWERPRMLVSSNNTMTNIVSVAKGAYWGCAVSHRQFL